MDTKLNKTFIYDRTADVLGQWYGFKSQWKRLVCYESHLADYHIPDVGGQHFKVSWYIFFVCVCVDMNLNRVTLIKESWELLPVVRYWSVAFLSKTSFYLHDNHWGKPICDLKYKLWEIGPLSKAPVWDLSGNSKSYGNTRRIFWGTSTE